jgi:hypothetical protein
LYFDPQFRDDPSEKVYESEAVTIPAGMAPQWVRFPLRAPIQIDNNPAYWLMLQSGDTAGVARDYGDGNANWVGVPDSFADGANRELDPFNDPQLTHGTVELSMYLEYSVPQPWP